MKIDCGDFILRPLEIEDADSITKYANNRNVWINLRDVFPHPYTKNDALNFIEFCQFAEAVVNFGIIVNDECVGIIGFNYLPDVYRKSAEFGYWLGQPFWTKGIMTKAVKELTKYIFSEYDFERIHSGVFEWNKASMKVLEKNGFKCEGISRKAVFKDGKIIDEHRYSLLKNE